MGWGAVWIPRIGQEVIVSFIEGDPDRPIIIGQVYNAQQMPPADLPKEKTTSTIRSLRTPLGDDTKNPNNEIRFIDTSGKEELQLLASKDHLLRVQNNSIEQIHHDQFVWIDNDLQIEVKNEIKVKAKKISLEATEVEVIVRGSEQSPTAKINIAGYFGYAEVNVETNGKSSLNGSDEINLNGKTIDIKGALVKINS
jgi:type VI secretion system secreted protein VgrG